MLAASQPGALAPGDERSSDGAGASEALHHLPASDAQQGDAAAPQEPLATSEAGSSPTGSAGSKGAQAEPQHPQQAHQRSASAAPSDETATLSSDSEHWQVVGSPRQAQRPVSAGNDQRERPAAVAEGVDEPAGAATPAVITEPSEEGPTPATAVASQTVASPISSAGGSVAGASDASPSVPAAAAAAPEDAPAAEGRDAAAAASGDELSDWGDDDEAALASAAVAGSADGKAAGTADEEEAWGSDWE